MKKADRDSEEMRLKALETIDNVQHNLRVMFIVTRYRQKYLDGLPSLERFAQTLFGVFI
jgi:hypothetical protein